MSGRLVSSSVEVEIALFRPSGFFDEMLVLDGNRGARPRSSRAPLIPQEEGATL
jgi:hypothetical protein